MSRVLGVGFKRRRITGLGSRGSVYQQQMFYGAPHNHRSFTLPIYHLLLAGKCPRQTSSQPGDLRNEVIVV